MKNLLLICLVYVSVTLHAQTLIFSEGKKATIVLTYDDALDSQINNAIPQLDKAGFKGTFFLKEPSSEVQVTSWRKASQNGHELANHTVYHPCLSSKYPADPRYHAENYTVATMLHEISTMNKLLYAIDNKPTHTYAFPCYETTVGGKSYMDSLSKCGFVTYARSGAGDPIITDFKKLKPFDVPCMGYSAPPTAKDLIDFVKKVQEKNGMAVFIFHGVGGDYLEVSAEAHQQLINYLKENSKNIWVPTFEQAMIYVTKK